MIGFKHPKYQIPPDAEGFLSLIDSNFLHCRRKKYSRFSRQWGGWSRKMNLVLRKKRNVVYKYIFIYWIKVSQLLEVYHKNRWQFRQKMKLAGEIKKLRKIIIRGDFQRTIAEEDLIKELKESMFLKGE